MKTGYSLSIQDRLPGGTVASEITTLIVLDGKEVKRTMCRGVGTQAVSVYVRGE